MKNPVSPPDRRRLSGLLRIPCQAVSLSIAWLLWIAAATLATGQVPLPVPAIPEPPVPLLIPPPPGVDVTVPAETTQPARVITKEQKIYVPFEKLEQVFKGQE